MFNLMIYRQPTNSRDFYKLKCKLFSQSGNYSAKSNIIQPNIIQPNIIQPKMGYYSAKCCESNIWLNNIFSQMSPLKVVWWHINMMMGIDAYRYVERLSFATLPFLPSRGLRLVCYLYVVIQPRNERDSQVDSMAPSSRRSNLPI